jgi:hypothetical protein
MAKVQYEREDDGDTRFWTAGYGRYAIQIDANRPSLYRWAYPGGRSIRMATLPTVTRQRARGERGAEELPLGI